MMYSMEYPLAVIRIDSAEDVDALETFFNGEVPRSFKAPYKELKDKTNRAVRVVCRDGRYSLADQDVNWYIAHRHGLRTEIGEDLFLCTVEEYIDACGCGVTPEPLDLGNLL